MKRERLDKLLVARGDASSREQARRLVMAGAVRLGDRVVDKPGALVPADAALSVVAPPAFVGRGGTKLDHALKELDVEASGAVALDVGASTGGFTDCLLQRGARLVYAVDVGYGQLDWSIRNDRRVVPIERTNARHLRPEQLPEIPTLAVIDVSFISLRLVLPAVVACLAPGGDVVALVKPQFEVGKGQVGKGGVVRDPQAQARVVNEIRTFGEALGLECRDECESPIVGAKGNREFLLAFRKRDRGGSSPQSSA